MDKQEFFIKELEKSKFTHKDAVRAVSAWITQYTDDGGYVVSRFSFHIFEDGHVTISDNDGDGFVSLEKRFVDVLLKMLEEQEASEEE